LILYLIESKLFVELLVDRVHAILEAFNREFLGLRQVELNHLVEELFRQDLVLLFGVFGELGDEGALLSFLLGVELEQRTRLVNELETGGQRVGVRLRNQEDELLALSGDLHRETVELLVYFVDDLDGSLHDGPDLVVAQAGELLRDLALLLGRALRQALNVLRDADIVVLDVLPVNHDYFLLNVLADLFQVDEAK